MLIFDIGFHCGEFANANLSRATRIISVEANPNLCRVTVDPKITLVNAAISDYNGIIPFYISNADTISTTSRDWIEGSRFTGHYSWSPPINVPCFTLDSLIVALGKPDFIKLDMEGSELEAVSGLSEVVS